MTMRVPRLRYSCEHTEYRYPFLCHGTHVLQRGFRNMDTRVTWVAWGLHPWGLVILKNSRGAEELWQTKPSPGTAAALLFLQIECQTQNCYLEMLACAHTREDTSMQSF